MIYFPVKFEFNWTKRCRVRVWNKNVDRQIDGPRDVGHINLIGGLVTRNPPKKLSASCCMYLALKHIHWVYLPVFQRRKT